MVQLRENQRIAVEKSMEYIQDPRRKRPELLIAPTAAGKSWIIASIADRFGGSILVLQPSKELLQQNIDKYRKLGNDASVFCAGLGVKGYDKQVTFATLGSIKSVVDKLKIDLLIIDEAHYKFSPDEGSEFMVFVEKLKPTKVIGLTATPFRLTSSMEGAMLKMLNRMRPSYFKDYIHIIQIQDMVLNGFWSKIRYETQVFDTSVLALNSNGSEFTESSVKAAVQNQSVPQRIYKRTMKLLKEGCPSILIFAESVETAKKLSEHIPDSTYIEANTTDKQREERVEGFKAGRYKVLINVGIFTTGFDYPDLRCIIMGRPTNSLALYYQIVGRGTRISEETGKTECLFIDFGANIERFGVVEHLVMEKIEGWGWAFCNGDYVLTNVLMGTQRVKKSSLEKKKSVGGEDVMFFGKHSGKPLSQIPVSYFEWLIFKSDIQFTSKKMIDLKDKMLKILDEHNTMLPKTA